MAKPKKISRIVASLKAIGLARLVTVSILGLVGAVFAFAVAASGVTRLKNPAAALAFMPDESVALAARADQILFANLQKPPKDVRTLALAALRQQAINPKAVRLLGFSAEANGDAKKAEAYVRHATKLSRREPGAQLWLIEASARRNETKQTLVHYDIVLRTKPDTQAILFPRLLAAIDDVEIRTALKPYVRAKRGWAGSFLLYANANSKNLSAVVDLIVETGGLEDPEVARGQELGLLWRLVGEERFADARRLYLQMKTMQPARLTKAGFDELDRDGRSGAMGWQLFEDPDAGGGFASATGNKKVSLSVFANAATTRPVAGKLLYLDPGNYGFTANVQNIDRGGAGFLRWQLRCPATKISEPIMEIDSTGTTAKTSFDIPAQCPVQFLYLIVSGGNGQTGLEATITDVAITPRSF